MRLHVDEHGSGEPIVLLHGLVASSRYWTTLLPHLPPGRRALAPDLLGFGRSPWPRVDYTVDAHLDALDDAIFRRLPGRLDLVGHSLGALLAHEWASRHPDRVRSLQLLALPYFDDEEEARTTLARGSPWVCLDVRARPLAWAACQCLCQRRRVWGPLVPALVRDVPPEVARDGLLHSFRSFDSTLRRILFAHRPEPAADRLERADVAVHLLGHRDDGFAPLQNLERYVRRRRNATLSVVDAPGRSHLFSIGAPARTGELLSAALGVGR